VTRHGITAYARGCRCATCRVAKAEQMRRYRQRAVEEMTEHGYISYTHGCRCEVCRTAKAEYMRQLRAPRNRVRRFVEGRPEAGRNYADGTVHGLSGYQNHSCRCEVCRAAKSQTYRRQRLARAR
jgi:hypothetical protein